MIISKLHTQIDSFGRDAESGTRSDASVLGFAKVLLFPLVFVVLISTPTPVLAYDGLSDLLGELFRGITGQKKPAPAVMINAMQQFPPLPEAELKKRKDRLIAYASVRKQWLHAHCQLSDEQSENLDKIFLAEIEASQERLKKNNNQRNQNGFPDYAPVRFTIDGAAAKNFSGTAWDRKIEEVLTPEQIANFEKAQNERGTSIVDAQRAWVLNLLDQELYFTSEQREVVSEQLEKRLSLKSSQLYSLSNQNYYLKYQQPHTLLTTLPDDVLNDPQKARLKRVKGGNVNGPASERYITFMSNDGVDGWYDTLEKAIDEQGQRLRGMADLQIRYYEKEYHLDQEGVDHLRLAAKGTALYCLASWKESTKTNLRQWEERMQQQQFGNGNFGFSISVPNVNSIGQHQLWRNAVEALSVDSSKIATEREDRRRELESKYLLSLLDKELLLTQKQREQIAILLNKKMPQKQISGYEYMYEIVLLAVPMVILEDEEVKEIFLASPQDEGLNEDDHPQLLAWEALKGQYQIKGRNVTMQMQNMGQFSFNIPK
ncbi:MAG: hypothetical protein HON04_03170 [Planctomicrobium sp.]|nr:hypothetical protein [Planctomicrobium sp.]